MLRGWCCCLALLAALAAADSPAADVSPVVARFPSASQSQFRFTHLAVDALTGQLFVGATNRLLQLSAGLDLLHQVATGPRNDSPLCHASGCEPGIPTTPTDTVNKMLLVDAEARRLIACGSTHQGACSRYSLEDISSPAEFIAQSIAANDANATTYAYIGPIRYNTWAQYSNVLYVGTTFTNNGDYRHDVPAVSSRNLDNLLIAEMSFSKQSQVMIDVKYRDHFLVQYVYGFNASEHAYFVIVQKQSHLPGQEEQGYISRLARTCIGDPNYDTYTEVTLQCVDVRSHINYNLVQDAKIAPAGQELARRLGVRSDDHVLIAAFRQARGITNEPLANSALCLYTLPQIEAKFDENVYNCLNGSVKYRNMGYVSGLISDGKCPAGGTHNLAANNLCTVGLKISGSVPILSHALLTFPNVSLSSVAVASPGGHLMAALGTTLGHLKKVLLSSTVPAEYEQLLVDPGHTILPDTQLSPSGEHLYVLSTGSVTKLRMETCSVHANCSACLEARDPYCGWCSLEKRCTVKAACQKATHSAPRWLSLGTGQQCIDFEQVHPDRIPISQMATVKLLIRTLPELPAGANYKCVFGAAEPIDAAVTPTGLSCPTPAVRARPAIAGARDHVLVPLSVRSSETNKDFVSRNFAYFDCSRHTTCMDCVKSQWACNWCVYENKCTHDVSSCKKTVISGENNPTFQVNHGASFCPRFAGAPRAVLLPNHFSHDIRFEVENLPHPGPGHTGFQCIVRIEGANMLVPARTENNRFVVCDKTTYSYNGPTGEYNASVRVVWNRSHHVDEAAITLYKCEVLGSHREHADCSLCVTRHRRYNCTWCGSQCAYAPNCQQTAHAECPRPRIDIIKPLSGPVEGGTLVTIEGSNLGLRERDVRDRIRIGEVPCRLVDYQVSVRIVCITGPSPSRRELTAPVVVGNEAGYTESSVFFSYRDIQLHGLWPPFGPQSGGTLLAITGHYLNIGNRVTAYLDDLVCAVNATQASSSRLTCQTVRAPHPLQVRKLTLMIDGANRTLAGNPFNYTADPTIMEIKPLKSFVSGGRMITVHGTNLDTIQNPEMEVYLENEVGKPLNRSVCVVLNQNQMECPSPAVSPQLLVHAGRTPLQRAREAQLNLRIGFLMDRVESVRDLEKHFPNLRSQLLYVENPRLAHFPGNVKLYKGDTLVIEGENLNSASDESDVNVTIGALPCNVTSLAQTQLVCTPPAQQPPGEDDLGLPQVVVHVGHNLRFQIGYLLYDVERYSTYAFPSEAIAGVAAGTLALLALFAAVLLVYCRRSTQAEREYKRIQIQMDTLESNVRSECKQAFAELQTDMTDLTADLESTGIPTFDHATYVMRVFFPGLTEHPILSAAKTRPRNHCQPAMLQFEQLINTKCFVLTLIETLEAQKTFNIRDKVNVASLLMVVLMGKMEYATELLKSLLLRLVDKSVNSKHPQLMLRRTETVVEKMLTNWMALCMYNYLKEYAGSSLFLLFKAIKHQVEKGLVDAVTHDARYSLSEERLLKEQIDYSVVTLHIVQDDLDEKVQCKVLDCDTISQVKSKILDALFKNTPFSMRPSIHELDLVYFPEWRNGRAGHLTLQDEDLTTKTVNGWRRVNTLAHYGVKEAAVMSLISRQNESFAPTCKQPCHNCTGVYMHSQIIAANGDVETGLRLYHLVKPVDEHHRHTDRERTHKAIPEIFLTRLLSTKGTIQKFVDDFFSTILTTNEALPPAIKWLFDLFDDAARHHDITDPEVVHAWKSNSLPLRFWVNFIKNPDFIFDVDKSPTVDSCLSVIAQTFMDACSRTEHRLGKDSPSNKLLFAKDIPHYRDMVDKFYSAVGALPQIPDQEMNTAMQELSAQQADQFDKMRALHELYLYVAKYREPVLEALDADHHCRKTHLAHKLLGVACTLDTDTQLC